MPTCTAPSIVRIHRDIRGHLGCPKVLHPCCPDVLVAFGGTQGRASTSWGRFVELPPLRDTGGQWDRQGPFCLQAYCCSWGRILDRHGAVVGHREGLGDIQDPFGDISGSLVDIWGHTKFEGRSPCFHTHSHVLDRHQDSGPLCGTSGTFRALSEPFWGQRGRVLGLTSGGNCSSVRVRM